MAMPGDIKNVSVDVEKATIDDDDALSSSSSISISLVPEPDKATETRPRGSRPCSIATRRSHESVACEPLEYALNPCLETESEREARESITYTRTGTSIASVVSRPPDFEVFFQEGDPENPRNWSKWYRAWIIIAVSYSTWVIVLHSTSYTAAIPGIMDEYGSTQTVTTLGLTTYLLGLAVGSLIVAPLSELYGRRMVYLLCLTIWALLILPCALATSLTELIVVRFFG